MSWAESTAASARSSGAGPLQSPYCRYFTGDVALDSRFRGNDYWWSKAESLNFAKALVVESRDLRMSLGTMLEWKFPRR